MIVVKEVVTKRKFSRVGRSHQIKSSKLRADVREEIKKEMEIDPHISGKKLIEKIGHDSNLINTIYSQMRREMFPRSH